MTNPRWCFVTFLLVSAVGPGVHAESPVDPGVQTVAMISNVTIIEGNTGTTPFTAQVSIVGSYTQLTLKIVATPGTADETDYTFAPTVLTFGVGSPTTQTVSGVIIGDVDPEGNETFWLSAIAVAGAPSSFLSSGGLVSITDDDRETAPWLYVDTIVVPEGNQGTATAEIAVRLQPASSNTVTVSFATKDATAYAGEDYVATSGTLTFAPGETRKTVPITILGDRVVERDEDFVIELSQAKAAVIGSERTLIVIGNDDAPIHTTIEDMIVDEGDTGITTVPVTVHFDRPASGNEKVQIALVGVTAVADQDFRAVGKMLYLSSGATEWVFTIDVLADLLPECDEGLLIVYSSLYMGDDTVKSAKLVLRNDDGPVPGCGADPFAPLPVEAPAWDGGTPDSPTPAGAMDARTVDGPTPAAPDMPAASDGGSAAVRDSGAGDVPAPSAPDVAAASDGGPTAVRDSGTGGVGEQDASGVPGMRASGCACSFAGAHVGRWLCLLAALGWLAMLRRPRRR